MFRRCSQNTIRRFWQLATIERIIAAIGRVSAHIHAVASRQTRTDAEPHDTLALTQDLDSDLVQPSERFDSRSEWPVRGSNHWRASSGARLSISSRGSVDFSADNVRFEYLLMGDTHTLSPGVYRIKLLGKMDVGGSALGLLDVAASRWVMTFHLPKDGAFESDFTIPSSLNVQLIVSAANSHRPGPVKGTLETVSITRESGLEIPRATARSNKIYAARQGSWTAPTWSRDDDSLLCFIHVHRTAGTSVTDLLRTNFPDSFRQFRVLGRIDGRACAKNFNSPDADIQAIIDDVSNPDQKLKVIAGHMTYGLHRRIARTVRYFALVREPLKRVASWYNLCLDDTMMFPLRETMLKYNFDFRRAIEAGVAPEFANDQTRMIIGSDKIELDDADFEQAKAVIEQDYIFVGTQERLSDCLPYLAEQLKLRDRNIGMLNLGRNTETIDAGLWGVFEQYNTIDYKLYDWVANDYLPRLIG